jgi:hypothetical protein
VIRKLSIVLVLSFTFATSAASSGLETVYDGAYRVTALDVAVDGTSVWVATSWGIALHETSTGTPRPVVTRPLAGTTSSVEVGSSRVYVGSGSTVHVFARSGSVNHVGSGDASGTINDLLLIGSYLYAATSSGVEQFDLLDPDKPLAIRTLTTSTGFALRLAVAGTSLYAADGDSSVEVYNIQIPSFPQGIGSFGSLARTQAVSEAGGRLYVSDGQKTDIWFGTGASMSPVGTIAAGGNSVIPFGNGSVYMAGDDRRLRVFDVTAASKPVKIFVSDAGPVGGTVNRLLRIATEGTRLHVAAGDAGLQTWETSGFEAPFLIRGYEGPSVGSVAAFTGGVVATLGTAGLARYDVGDGGELTERGAWDSGTASVAQDASDSTLLVSSGSRLRRFDLTPSTPVETGSVTLAAPVRSAVLVNGNAVAVLFDQTVWNVDFTAGSVSKANLGEARPLFVAAGNGDLAFAEFNEDGTTTVLFFDGGNLEASPVTSIVDGAASSGIALSNARVACFTFRGISLVDFSAGGAVTVIPESNIAIARDLTLSGTTLLILTSTSLQVWNTASQTLEQDVALEGSVTAVAHSASQPSAIVGTGEGLVSVQFASGSEPDFVEDATGGTTRYFREALLGDRALHLWDGRDVLSRVLDLSGIPGPGRVVSAAESAIGVAAVGERLYFLTPAGEVAGYSAAGLKVVSYQVDESVDQRLLSIRSVAGALWVSVEVNCLSGGCEFRTLVLDPRSEITKTATMSGGVIAADERGTAVRAIFEVPDEIRTIDVASPYHPTVVAQSSSTGSPVALAYDQKRGATYVLGDVLYVYDSGLNLAAQLLEPYEADPTGRLGYIDQGIHVLDDQAVVTGRTFSPQVYTINSATAWFPAELPGSGAAAVRSSVVRGGMLYLLSDYSLEIWSSSPIAVPRRRPIR